MSLKIILTSVPSKALKEMFEIIPTTKDAKKQLEDIAEANVLIPSSLFGLFRDKPTIDEIRTGGYTVKSIPFAILPLISRPSLYGGHRVVVPLYGPNEGGKTTALSQVRKVSGLKPGVPSQHPELVELYSGSVRTPFGSQFLDVAAVAIPGQSKYRSSKAELLGGYGSKTYKQEVGELGVPGKTYLNLAATVFFVPFVKQVYGFSEKVVLGYTSRTNPVFEEFFEKLLGEGNVPENKDIILPLAVVVNKNDLIKWKWSTFSSSLSEFFGYLKDVISNSGANLGSIKRLFVLPTQFVGGEGARSYPGVSAVALLNAIARIAGYGTFVISGDGYEP